MTKKSPEEQAIDWLDEKWPSPRSCLVCMTVPKWSVSGPYATSVLEGRDIQLNTYTPMMYCTCTNCGYTHQFSAVVMGIVLGSPDD